MKGLTLLLSYPGLGNPGLEDAIPLGLTSLGFDKTHFRALDPNRGKGKGTGTGEGGAG